MSNAAKALILTWLSIACVFCLFLTTHALCILATGVVGEICAIQSLRIGDRDTP